MEGAIGYSEMVFFPLVRCGLRRDVILSAVRQMRGRAGPRGVGERGPTDKGEGLLCGIFKSIWGKRGFGRICQEIEDEVYENWNKHL